MRKASPVAFTRSRMRWLIASASSAVAPAGAKRKHTSEKGTGAASFHPSVASTHPANVRASRTCSRRLATIPSRPK